MKGISKFLQIFWPDVEKFMFKSASLLHRGHSSPHYGIFHEGNYGGIQVISKDAEREGEKEIMNTTDSSLCFTVATHGIHALILQLDQDLSFLSYASACFFL
jgi:hypothetical protein